MADLNEILKNKAASKLNKEINEWLAAFKNHRFFKTIQNTSVPLGEDGKTTPLSTFLYNDEYAAGQKVKEKFLDTYIQDEANYFINKVEEIRDSLEEINSNKDY